MSDTIKIKTEPSASSTPGSPVRTSNNVAFLGSSGPAVPPTPQTRIEVIDLLSDSDEDDDDVHNDDVHNDAQSRGSTSTAVTATAVASRVGGGYATLGIYASSLRKRSARCASFPEEDEEECDDEKDDNDDKREDGDVDAVPPAGGRFVNHPRKKGKTFGGPAGGGGSGSGSESNSVPLGAVGYKFRKEYVVDGHTPRERIVTFHGEVIEILDEDAPNKKGKYRRCLYNDGDTEDLSLEELRSCKPLAEDDVCPPSGVSSEDTLSDASAGQCQGGSSKPGKESVRGKGASGGDEAFSVPNILDKIQVEVRQHSTTPCKATRKSSLKSEDGDVSNQEGGDQNGGTSQREPGGEGPSVDGLFDDSSSEKEDGEEGSGKCPPRSDNVTITTANAVEGNTGHISLEDETKSAVRAISDEASNTSTSNDETSHHVAGAGASEENGDDVDMEDNCFDHDASANALSSGQNECRLSSMCTTNSDDEDLFASSNNEEDSNALSSDKEDLFASSGDEEDLFASSGNEEDSNPSSNDDEDLFPSSDEDKVEEDECETHDDEDLFPSSEEDEEEEYETHGHPGRFLNVTHPDYDDDDDDGRFSIASDDDGDESNIIFPSSEGVCNNEEERHFPKQVVLKKWGTTLVTDYTVPIVEREVPECYYLAIAAGDRIKVRERPLGSGPPPIHFKQYGMKYEIIFSELIARKGKGPAEDGMGKKNFKSHYLAVSGPGLETMKVKDFLSRIGDFESKVYEKGAHKAIARAKLLVSPCSRPPGGKMVYAKADDFGQPVFRMRRLNKSLVSVIEDNGHLGCGFIPRSLLVEVLGNSQHLKKASIVSMRMFAIQIRMFAPSSAGISKGMLMVKDGIDKIQIPSSMVKVDKSKAKPLHDDVVLNVHKCFPWEAHKIMGRLINDHLKDPTAGQVKNLKPPCDDVMRVLECKGVDKADLCQYLEEFKQQQLEFQDQCKLAKASKISLPSAGQILNRVNHATLVGVMDPTGLIPSGSVFIPGMSHKTPLQVFVTRNPCTEGKDGMVVTVALLSNMPDEVVEFFDSLGFGALVFPLGDELPTRINDGDLDGDPYFCMWDGELLGAITHDHDCAEEESGMLADDDVVGTDLQYEIDGKLRDVKVVHKLQENPDKYLVEADTEGEMQIELTREQIFEGKDVLSEVLGHRSQGRDKYSKGIEFHCKWTFGENIWESPASIRKIYSAPPQTLSEYAQSRNLLKNGLLPTKFCKWLKLGLVETDMQKIRNHKTVDGKIEVCCHYDNGDESWIPIKEAKKDCKLFLGAYARENNLFGQPGWRKMDGYWLKEMQDVMCRQMRSNEINRLVSTLYRKWATSFDDEKLGPKHWETNIWGPAYKQSLEIEKHGGVLQLPLLLYRKLSVKQQKYADTMSS